jgi:cytochrome c
MFTIAILTWLAGTLAQLFPPPPPPRLPDAAAGDRVFRVCAPCHTGTQGGPHKIGPNLFGMMDQPAGKRADFRYSNAMMAKAATGLIWNEDALRAYLADPRAFLPGGSKAFAGIKDEQRMADLIAYLRTLK